MRDGFRIEIIVNEGTKTSGSEGIRKLGADPKNGQTSSEIPTGWRQGFNEQAPQDKGQTILVTSYGQ